MNKNDKRTGNDVLAAIAAAISASLGHGNFAIKSIRHSATPLKKFPGSEKKRGL